MQNIGVVEAPDMGAILEADDRGLRVTALKSAMELDLFSLIDAGHRRVEEIAAAASCSRRGMGILLDALCPLGLLTKAHDGYHLTPASEAYLVRGSPAYCVPIYLAWLQNRERFTEFVRTGQATLDLTAPEAEDLWVSYAAPARLQWPELVAKVRRYWALAGITATTWPGAHILDLGCGAGYKSFALLQDDPAAHVTAVDSPKVLAVAAAIAEEMGIAAQVTFHPGDMTQELPFQAFDVVLFGSVLHYFDAATATAMLRSASAWLRPGGMVVVFSKSVDEDRMQDLALLSTIDVGNGAPCGRNYTPSEYRQILEVACFVDVTQPDPLLITGRKEHEAARVSLGPANRTSRSRS